MKKLLLTGIMTTSALTLASCGKEVEPTVVGGGNDLVVGMECAYAPFNWTEETNNDYNYAISNQEGKFCAGYDVDVAIKIAEDLGMNLVIKAIAWDGLIPALESDDIDVIIAGMSPTEERKLAVDFADDYYETTHVAIVDANFTIAAEPSIQDLAGLKGIAQLNTVYDRLIDQVNNVNHLPGVDTVALAVQNVQSNSADFTIVEKPVATQLLDVMNNDSDNENNIQMIEFTTGFTVADEDKYVSPALRKNDDALTDAINVFLSTFTSAQRETLMNKALTNSGS